MKSLAPRPDERVVAALAVQLVGARGALDALGGRRCRRTCPPAPPRASTASAAPATASMERTRFISLFNKVRALRLRRHSPAPGGALAGARRSPARRAGGCAGRRRACATFGSTGSIRRSRAAASVASTVSQLGQELEVLDRGEDERELVAARAPRARRPGVIQRASTHSPPSGVASAPSGRARGEEPRVEADVHELALGRDPARERHQLGVRRRSAMPASSSSSRTAVAAWSASSPRWKAPPGNTHAPPMKRCSGFRWTSSTSAPSARVPQQDQRRGLARLDAHGS